MVQFGACAKSRKAKTIGISLVNVLLYNVCSSTIHDSCCKERNLNLNVVLLMTKISLKIHIDTGHNNVVLPSNVEKTFLRKL